MVIYRQCEFQRTDQDGVHVMTAWIPKTYARVGRYVRLGERDGWRVTSVGAEQPYDMLRAFERQTWSSLQ